MITPINDIASVIRVQNCKMPKPTRSDAEVIIPTAPMSTPEKEIPPAETDVMDTADSPYHPMDYSHDESERTEKLATLFGGSKSFNLEEDLACSSDSMSSLSPSLDEIIENTSNMNINAITFPNGQQLPNDKPKSSDNEFRFHFGTNERRRQLHFKLNISGSCYFD